MSDDPKRIWVRDYDVTGWSDEPETRGRSEGSCYILATPAALAEVPEVAKLIERAILDAQLRCMERGRIDTPDEIRAEAAALRGKGE